jgi:7-cyano-7-deazaguanine synthase
MARAVVLLSGGMDSATVAAVLRSEGHEVHALLVDYGQRHKAELAAARAVAAALGLASTRTVAVDLRALGGSALTADLPSGEWAVPKDRPYAAIGADVPVTYVPARNTVLLGLALAAAEVLDADLVGIGVNALDCSGYPDCRPAFLDAMRSVAAAGTRRGAEGRPVRIVAPLLGDSKADIVRRGHALGVPFGSTLSCYDPVERSGRVLACGRCDACRLRARGFHEAGLTDPAPRA